MRVLLIKMSSMGDMIHALPALTDAAKVYPDIRFDWVAEEAFTEIPPWHSQVDNIIVIGLRRWAKNPWQAVVSGELKKFYQQLTATHYDFVIDAQAIMKSAVITRLARGKRYGYDAASVRSRFANLACDENYAVDQKLHAITRIRHLFAKILGYPIPETAADFGINIERFEPLPFKLPENYAVFVHNASWTSKVWPEEYWVELIKRTTQKGINVLLPWGNSDEKARAERLAAVAEHKRGLVLPKLKLSQLGTLLLHAKAAVLVDTGLGHLAGALNVPAISLYSATDPALIRTMGKSQIHLQVNFPCAPCKLRQCNYVDPSAQQPACFMTVPPEKVWQELEKII